MEICKNGFLPLFSRVRTGAPPGIEAPSGASFLFKNVIFCAAFLENTFDCFYFSDKKIFTSEKIFIRFSLHSDISFIIF